MSLIFVVDAESIGLSADLNVIAQRDGLDLSFRACENPEIMFREIEKKTPDLILLHHNWEGLNIMDILGRISTMSSGETRVIIFTGQEVKINELIDCVRGGVADYWRKNALTLEEQLRKISFYCGSPSWRLNVLQLTSGSLRQLLERTDGAIQELAQRDRETGKLRREVASLKSRERNRLLSGVVTIAYAAVVVGLAVLLDRSTNYTPASKLGLVGGLAVFFLFMEGRIRKFIFKAGKASGQISAH